MKKILLFLATLSLAIATMTPPALAHQSEYSYCASKRGGKMYAIGNQHGWRAACRDGDTLVQQREVVRTATCALYLEVFPIALCSCETGEVAAFSRVASTTPEGLSYNLQIADITEWMPNLTPPEQHLLFLADPVPMGGRLTIEYTCTSH